MEIFTFTETVVSLLILAIPARKSEAFKRMN